MIKIGIEGEAKQLLKCIISTQQEGGLYLGMTGANLEPATLEDLFEREVLFKDYVMEGFVKVTLKAFVLPQGLELLFNRSGYKREQYLGSHFKYLFSQAGHNATIVQIV